MLTCNRVSLRVAERILCNDLSVRFEPGQVWAVLGRNGMGKSTLIHALAGIARPYTGDVELDGHIVFEMPVRSRALSIALLPQIEEGSYWGTVLEYTTLGRFPHTSGWNGFARDDESIARAALDALDMHMLADRSYGSLSGGERQRVRLAQVLAQQPRIFLLDEPLQHLDLAFQARVLEILGKHARESGQTVVMVLHEALWIGAACTHVLLFDGAGGVQAGPADALLTRHALERAYGCRLREVAAGERRSFVPDV
jgi:iron complex transport system ATP-binding protein